MRQANLVATELWQAGFRAKVVTSDTVKVSLSSRKVSTMEVSVALDQIFEGIDFQVQSIGLDVLVSW